MALEIQYIIDEKGQKTSVLVPIKKWEELNEDIRRIKNKLRILTGIEKGLNEVKNARKSRKELQTLKDFLNESNG